MTQRAIARRFAALIFFVPVHGLAADTTQGCHLLQVASLPMETQPDGGISVPASANGRPVQLLVDTGSIYSSLTITTARELNLTGHALPFPEFELLNNRRITEYTRLQSFGLGGTAMGKNLTFLVLPGGSLDASLSGLLGPDVLRNFDIELDFAGGRMNVLAPNTCPRAPVYWTHEGYAGVPIEVLNDGHINLTAKLDGQSVRIVLDTGASRSTMALETARDLFRWEDSKVKTMPPQRINNGPEVPIYIYPFAALAFEGVQVVNPDIDLIPKTSYGDEDAQVILGMSVLRQLHLYIGYKAQMLYVTAAEMR